MVMRSFLLFQGSQPGLFYDLSASRYTGLRFPPLIRHEKVSGLPPVTSEKASFPSRHCKQFNALSSNRVPSVHRIVFADSKCSM